MEKERIRKLGILFLSLQGRRAIQYKWVYTTNMSLVESRTHLKACLIANGYDQTYEIDYVDAFLPTAKLSSTHSYFSCFYTSLAVVLIGCN